MRMFELVYETDSMKNVGMVGVVNEPVQDQAMTSSMQSNIYLKAVEVKYLGLVECLWTNNGSAGEWSLSVANGIEGSSA
ncbi:CAZyme family GH5 [Penicillium coprophilum]|uniref:CAZyme family GH5 n=1 Tax=Penicillium coprophilum TaxID=36646 RepID=UPI002398BF58|nr:CAZyme family GH5 [Penicillium coprophilum]KAJ5170084.1 CAZyme family GH5 [Penicillium coprophilum]